jgi:N-acetylglucosaminyldiphosphoundecaprenol N-acetyl-beta-D-mannosaminyltransferase
VAFYGGSEQTIESLVSEVRRRYPQLKIAFTMSPPFRALSPAEDEAITKQISESGAPMVFVGLDAQNRNAG